jgi:hypothetical protein
MPAYTTTHGNTIPARAIRATIARLKQGDDWQRVATEELRDYIPEHDDDLSEANEVLSHCEQAIEDEDA